MRESARSPACQDFVARSRNWSGASAVAGDDDDGEGGGGGGCYGAGGPWWCDFARGSG